MRSNSVGRIRIGIVAVSLLLLAQSRAPGEEGKPLCSFDNDSTLKSWEFSNGHAPSDQHVTHGKRTLKLPAGGDKTFIRFDVRWNKEAPMDWSAYDTVKMEVFADGNAPVKVEILVVDKEGKEYWDWHTRVLALKPGANTLELPVRGLWRGQASAHKSDLKSPMVDTRQVVMFALTFTGTGKTDAVYLNNPLLIKEPRPDGIAAFDFGPEEQSVFPGFLPISWNTVYAENGATAGFKHRCGNPNCARDDTFPTRLYQDYVLLEPNNEFIADMPNGKCHVWLVFDDCGYWDSEQARHKKRTIIANDKESWVDDRGEDGPTDYLFRFEKIEPKPGDSVWDLYTKELFKPARFDAEVTDGKLRIRCTSDAWWSTKVAALIICPDSIKAAGETWVAQVEERNKTEFERNALFLGPKQAALDIPADAKDKGYWLGYPNLEDDVTLCDPPGKAGPPSKCMAFRGQRTHFTFAVRPLKDFGGEVMLTSSDLTGPGGVIPARCVEPRYAHHRVARESSQQVYSIVPRDLGRVAQSGLKMSRDFTRQFVTILNIPPDAKPGIYNGTLSLSAGELKITLPISVEVFKFTLDEPDFFYAFFGANVPQVLPENRRKNGWTELASLLRQNGMNSFCGGPAIHFNGLDASSKPQLDFTTCDEFFDEMKRLGFNKPMYSCGGPGNLVGLHDPYAIGATGHNWEKKTGKSFGELLKLVWGAIQEHADAHGWPPLYYYFIEEPGSIGAAQGTLELAQAYRDAVPSVRFGGYYSIAWNKSDPVNLKLQELLKTACWSGLGLHNQTDLDKAKEFGREVHIYNQALSRYSFGAYQWAEMHKGVKGRAQWNTLALYGYQFFDLDGREPDAGVINWGRDEILPTLNLARCCEGITDFRLAVTLWNLAEKMKDNPDAVAAKKFLEETSQNIPAGTRTPPAGFMSDEQFRNACVEHLKKLQAQ